MEYAQEDREGSSVMTDVYDEQIAYLTEHPEKIRGDWYNGKGLFAFLGEGYRHGCLTLIKDDPLRTCDVPGLAERIRKDDRVPSCANNITPASLPVFAEYQREYRRLKEKQ